MATDDDFQNASQTPPWRGPLLWILARRGPLLWILAISGCVFGAGALIQGYFFSEEPNDRFYLVQGKDGVVTEVDRKTGQTWRIAGNRKYEILHKEDVETLPDYLRDQISGVASKSTYDRESLVIKFYNGTNWTIREITIRVHDRTGTGRLYRKSPNNRGYETSIEPLSSGTINFDVGAEYLNSGKPWEIVEARGYSP